MQKWFLAVYTLEKLLLLLQILFSKAQEFFSAVNAFGKLLLR
ncbi:MAG: hypothetical protein RSB10_00065 [Clostridia bacterium]